MKLLKVAAAAVFWIIVWEAASLLLGDNLSMFLPSPFAVMKRWGEIILMPIYLKAAAATLLRIITGFISGAVLGVLLGVLTSSSSIAYILISPALKVIRAVPVVSFVILAFLFMSVDILPLFISFLMVVPLVWQTSHDSISGADIRLCEMGKVFGLSKLKILLKIRLPLAFSSIVSACVSALGFAWKSGVAAEVICTPELSLGHEIFRGKFNLDYETVYAVTLTVVILSLIIEILLKNLTDRYLKRGSSADA